MFTNFGSSLTETRNLKVQNSQNQVESTTETKYLCLYLLYWSYLFILTTIIQWNLTIMVVPFLNMNNNNNQKDVNNNENQENDSRNSNEYTSYGRLINGTWFNNRNQI